MVKYKVRIVSKTGTVVPELQVLHVIFFFLRNQNLMYNLCIPQVVVPTHMAFFFQINEQIETNHPCHERNWTSRKHVWQGLVWPYQEYAMKMCWHDEVHGCRKVRRGLLPNENPKFRGHALSSCRSRFSDWLYACMPNLMSTCIVLSNWGRRFSAILLENFLNLKLRTN